MARSANAQLAVDLFEQLVIKHGWKYGEAWKGIAILLLTCQVWRDQWRNLHDVVVYREVNDFKYGKKGPNIVIQRGEKLTAYLAKELGFSRSSLCSNIGQYWEHNQVSDKQPHNLVGHAFRSITVRCLELFGDRGITYEEEVSPHSEFPGYNFNTRSKDPKIDIVARRGHNTVALISSRWRFRHDRVDVVEEALAYSGAAQRHNPNCKLYASVAEFSPNRLEKILSNCPPAHPHPSLSAAVHFNPALVSNGLGENGRLVHLQSLKWLIEQTYSWK